VPPLSSKERGVGGGVIKLLKYENNHINNLICPSGFPGGFFL